MTPGPCPSCGAQAKVVGFFDRSGNQAKRAVLGSDFERANAHRLVCDACGADRTPPGAGPPPESIGDARSGSALQAIGGAAWRTTAIAAMMLGGLGVVMGVAIGGAAGIAIAILGGLFGAGVGGLLWARGSASKQAAKERFGAAREHAILDLAEKRGGRLTATEVARALRISVGEADAALTAMADGSRVSAEVSDDGVVVYDFRELRAARQRVEVRVDAGTEAEAETVDVGSSSKGIARPEREKEGSG